MHLQSIESSRGFRLHPFFSFWFLEIDNSHRWSIGNSRYLLWVTHLVIYGYKLSYSWRRFGRWVLHLSLDLNLIVRKRAYRWGLPFLGLMIQFMYTQVVVTVHFFSQKSSILPVLYQRSLGSRPTRLSNGMFLSIKIRRYHGWWCVGNIEFICRGRTCVNVDDLGWEWRAWLLRFTCDQLFKLIWTPYTNNKEQTLALALTDRIRHIPSLEVNPSGLVRSWCDSTQQNWVCHGVGPMG